MSQDSVLSSEPDSDRRIPVLQTGALTASPSERLAEAGGFEPPGRSAARIVSSDVPSASRPCFLSMAGIEGFEPPAHGLTVRCSAAELYPHCPVCLKGIEPLATGATTRCSSIRATDTMYSGGAPRTRTSFSGFSVPRIDHLCQGSMVPSGRLELPSTAS